MLSFPPLGNNSVNEVGGGSGVSATRRREAPTGFALPNNVNLPHPQCCVYALAAIWA